MATSDPRITIHADDKTKAAFGSVDKSLKNMKKTAIAASVAIAAAATAVIAIVKATTDATRGTIAFSNALGVSVENLSRWEFAAESVGLAGDKVGDIMKDAADKIGDAFRNNAGEAKEAIESLGLDLEALAKLSPDQQLLRIADALVDVKTTAEKVFILESIGNDLSLMLPLLEDNAEGLKNMADRADELGVTLTAFEAEQILVADRAFKDLEATMDALGQTITSVVAGPLSAMLDELNNFIPKALGFVSDAFILTGATVMAFWETLTPSGITGPKSFSEALDENIIQLLEVARLAAAAKDKLNIDVETQDDPEQLAFEARERLRQEELNAALTQNIELSRIHAHWTQKRIDFEFMAAQQKTKFVLGEATKITRGVAHQSRALFEINKAASIADALMSTFQAFNNALADYPPYVNFVMAGITMAAGLAQVQAIRSTSFGGGGGGGASGVGSPALSPPSDAATVPDIGQFQGPTEIHVTVEGTGLITRDQAEMIAESIGQFINDGGDPLPT